MTVRLTLQGIKYAEIPYKKGTRCVFALKLQSSAYAINEHKTDAEKRDESKGSRQMCVLQAGFLMLRNELCLVNSQVEDGRLEVLETLLSSLSLFVVLIRLALNFHHGAALNLYGSFVWVEHSSSSLFNLFLHYWPLDKLNLWLDFVLLHFWKSWHCFVISHKHRWGQTPICLLWQCTCVDTEPPLSFWNRRQKTRREAWLELVLALLTASYTAKHICKVSQIF